MKKHISLFLCLITLLSCLLVNTSALASTSLGLSKNSSIPVVIYAVNDKTEYFSFKVGNKTIKNKNYLIKYSSCQKKYYASLSGTIKSLKINDITFKNVKWYYSSEITGKSIPELSTKKKNLFSTCEIYRDKNNATLDVTAKGKGKGYDCTLTLICENLAKPSKAKITQVYSKNKGSLYVKWRKPQNADYCGVEIATKKDFSDRVSANFLNAQCGSDYCLIKGLAAGRKYYVRIRTEKYYKKGNSGAGPVKYTYSKSKSIKIK